MSKAKRSAAIVTIQEANGRVVSATVHGAGGPIPAYDAEGRIRVLIKRAGAGKALPVYEPKPGHVRAYTHLTAGDVDETQIDLRGATLISVR